MPCYSPLTAYYSRFLNPSGKRSLVFNVREALDDKKIKIACYHCIGCRLERTRQTAIRCVHEASLYPKNSFITLTYNQQNLPPNNSLQLHHFQNFMKRLRKQSHHKIRVYYCGEYGEKYKRPHYHAILFNHDFDDKMLFKRCNKNNVYTSETLSALWPFGFSSIGDVTFESAAYVARYVTKKISGSGPDSELMKLFTYTDFDPNTGEVYSERVPEFANGSRRPGIGKPWLEKYKTDVYPEDFVVLNNKKLRPPKYYDRLLEIDDPFMLDSIKERRTKNALKNAHDHTAQRLLVREKLQYIKFKRLIRNLENDL